MELRRPLQTGHSNRRPWARGGGVALALVTWTVATMGPLGAAPQAGDNPSVTLDVTTSDGVGLLDGQAINVVGAGFGASGSGVTGNLLQSADLPDGTTALGLTTTAFSSSGAGTFSQTLTVTKTFHASGSGGADFIVDCAAATCFVEAYSSGGNFNARHSISFVGGGGSTKDAYADFNGDGITDLSVFRPSSGAWFIQGNANPVYFGLPGDIPVPADYNGDGRDEIAVFRPSSGAWFIQGVPNPVFHGLSTDIPVPADYDGDGRDDIAVYRPSSGAWYLVGQNPVFFGNPGDIPVPANYDADAADDRAVFRPSSGAWFVEGSNPVFLGLNGDVPVPNDYDGNGRADFAVFRPSVGAWYGVPSQPRFLGLNGDIPVPGNYDADTADEIAVFRRTSGGWFIESAGAVFFGIPGDIPLPLPNRIYRFFTFAGA